MLRHGCGYKLANAGRDTRAIQDNPGHKNYLYADAELNGLASPITGLSRAARRVHVLFNNNYQDYGQRNALQLTKILSHAG